MPKQKGSSQRIPFGRVAGDRIGLHEWLATTKDSALSRGGRAWRKTDLSRLAEHSWQVKGPDHLFIEERQPGEIANPITGEVVSGCLTIGRLAESLGFTTDQLTDRMERLQLVQRVLDYREVPMVCCPASRKPRYFMTPVVTYAGMAGGLVVSIKTSDGGRDRGLILITPAGQQLIRGAGSVGKRPERKAARRRELVAQLLREGHSQAEIVRLTALPKQTVSRHVWALSGKF